ncbi:sarcosine oxidase subunit gamma [Shimia sp. R9_2]|uniref:sarcosine oxidase subunit gamma n=1 Tax=Shimia sp. R9_2 TaxID=2821112 RepID=UPI001ADB611E|nr:sarcosine oxidase subunit gamma [Shimia sp. R9_2]MBO9398846.1 sarcosine oxidase subunit gamma [Shimia sp. R9_2]
MFDLKPTTALGEENARIDVVGAFTISENPNCSLASLAARKGQEAVVAGAIEVALGIDLPGPGGCVTKDDHRFWWSGPGQWMIEADHDTHPLLAQEIKEIVRDAGAVTEQTDGWCLFDIEGANPEALFERLCAVDVPDMSIGTATRTNIHHIGCFLIREEARFNVVGPRSSAGSLHSALVEVAAGLP